MDYGNFFSSSSNSAWTLLYSWVYLVLAVHQNHSKGECPRGWGSVQEGWEPGEEPCSDVYKDWFSHWTSCLGLSKRLFWWFQTGRFRSLSSRCFHSLSWWWSLLNFVWQVSQLSVTQLWECRSAVSLFQLWFVFKGKKSPNNFKGTEREQRAEKLLQNKLLMKPSATHLKKRYCVSWSTIYIAELSLCVATLSWASPGYSDFAVCHSLKKFAGKISPRAVRKRPKGLLLNWGLRRIKNPAFIVTLATSPSAPPISDAPVKSSLPGTAVPGSCAGMEQEGFPSAWGCESSAGFPRAAAHHTHLSQQEQPALGGAEFKFQFLPSAKTTTTLEAHSWLFFSYSSTSQHRMAIMEGMKMLNINI